MTEPTTSFDLSTPEKVEKLRAEVVRIEVDLAEPNWNCDDRAVLTRRRDRILKALEERDV